MRRAGGLVRNPGESCADALDQFHPARPRVERISHPLDVSEDFVEAIWRKRNDLRPRAEPLGDGGFNLALADRADFALGLSDDHVGTKFAQPGCIDAIDRERVANDLFHSLVDLRAGTLGVELRFGQRRQPPDRTRKVAFVRAADQLIFETERANDLGRAWQQGHDSRHLNTTPRRCGGAAGLTV